MLISLLITYFENFNYCLQEGEFPSARKHADVVPKEKKKKPIKQIIDW